MGDLNHPISMHELTHTRVSSREGTEPHPHLDVALPFSLDQLRAVDTRSSPYRWPQLNCNAHPQSEHLAQAQSIVYTLHKFE
jgi:hypothetical protein